MHLMQRDLPELISTHTGSTVTKDELRAELERQEQRYKEVYGGEVTTYAAQPEPERKAWRKRPTVQDQVFKQEIEKIESESGAKAIAAAVYDTETGFELHYRADHFDDFGRRTGNPRRNQIRLIRVPCVLGECFV